MIGKQIINNVIEFFNAYRPALKRFITRRSQSKTREQWEKDNDLFDFNSKILNDEYLELGKSLFIICILSFSFRLFFLFLVIQFGFVTLFVTAFPYVLLTKYEWNVYYLSILDLHHYLL